MVTRTVMAWVLGLSLLLIPQVGVAQSVDELFERGNAAQSQGRYEDAEQTWRRVLQIDPNNVDAHIWLGLALYYQGKLDEAIAAYNRAIQLNPELAEAHNNLGIALYDQGNLDEAIAAYNRAIQLNPESATAYYNLGIALSDQGKLDEAIAAYRTALRLPDEQGPPASTHTLAHNALGYALQQQGNLQEAISQYQTALQLDPEFPQAITNLREAQRLLALRENPLPDDREERLPSLEENPYFPLQRSVVLILTETPSGFQYGTGWVIQRDGDITLIVTNRHVVSDGNSQRPSDSIEIELYSQNDPEHRLRFPARIRNITAPDDRLDLAILEVRNLPDDIEPLPLASSPAPMLGDLLIIGHPFTGNPWTMETGRVANIVADPTQQNLQIGGASLAVGNSGSPVIYNDEVVGLLVTIGDELGSAPPTGQGNSIGGFGFAYPLDVLAQHLQDWGIRF